MVVVVVLRVASVVAGLIKIELCIGFGIDIQVLVGVHNDEGGRAYAGVRHTKLVASCQDVEDCLLGWGLIIRVVLPGQCDQIVGWKHLCCRELNVACMKKDCKQKRASKKRQSKEGKRRATKGEEHCEGNECKKDD